MLPDAPQVQAMREWAGPAILKQAFAIGRDLLGPFPHALPSWSAIEKFDGRPPLAKGMRQTAGGHPIQVHAMPRQDNGPLACRYPA